MKKILIIILLLGNVPLVHCQQLFTHIPNQNYANVYEVAEIGNHYYFLARKSWYDTNNVVQGGTYVYKTDFNGNILDSLVLAQPSYPGIITITAVNNILTLYTTRGSDFDFLGYAAKFSLGRMRYDSNFNYIDSFATNIPQSGFRDGYFWFAKQYEERILFVSEGKDTALNSSSPVQQDKLFMLDTAGNFLFEKVLIDSLPHKYTDITSTNNGKNFIVRLGGTDTITNYTGNMIRLLDDSLNLVKWAPEPISYYSGFNGLDKYSSDKFTMGFIKGGGQQSKDSFCVELRDTNFNLLRQTLIPRHPSLSTYTFILGNAFDTRWYDGSDKDNIYIGNNWGSGGLSNSYFSLSNLDSNLNIRWSKVFGGDFPYQIERYTSVSDGGCFVMGIRRLGNNNTDPREAVVFKVSSMGVITNIASFAPSAQAYFEIYPNPSNGVAHIKNVSGLSYELMILSQEGKVISRTQAISEPKHTIDLSGQASGVYFYKIFTSDGRSAIGKLIVE